VVGFWRVGSDVDGGGDAHTASVDWGDGSPAAASPLEDRGAFGSGTLGHTYEHAGTYMAVFTVCDTGGCDSATTVVSATSGDTDPGPCARSQGFWGHEYRGKGKPHLDTATLTGYLAVVDVASAVFSESVPAATIAEAGAALKARGNPRARATAQALAAWLNFAHGAVGWTEQVTANLTFEQVVAEIETILLVPSATKQALEHAKDLAEAVNLRDQGCAC
jgi:hypothetical protein